MTWSSFQEKNETLCDSENNANKHDERNNYGFLVMFQSEQR